MKKILLSPVENIQSDIVVPIGGSKSYTNRALIMASLAQGISTVRFPSTSADSRVLIEALRMLGVSVHTRDDGAIEIAGNGGKFLRRDVAINVGHAGTAMRFLTALCALVPGKVVLDGSPRMRERPIGELVSALVQLGVHVEFKTNEGFPPLMVHGGVITKNIVTISGKVSSQFITSLLLIGPCIQGGLTILIPDEQISGSYIDMTIDGMEQFGVTVVNEKYRKYTIVPGSKYRAREYAVEGDASGASYLFGVAALTKKKITVSNINPLSKQGDVKFSQILEEMGCIVTRDEKKNEISVTGPDKLKAVTVDMHLMPDTAQTIAVVAAFAKGTTKITGLSTLKVKETDRLIALKNELEKMGVTCSVTDDSIQIVGGRPHGTSVATYHDHRMALAFAIAGAVIPGMEIEDSDVVIKSFPSYWEVLRTIGIGVTELI